MITEILGALIVLGAVLVLIMRRLLSKGKAKEKESVEVSASRLRYEIERSGDAVIGRMQIHVERLERILAEANAQKAALDERLAALAQWEKVYGARLGALPQQMEFASSAPRTATQAPPTVSPVTAAPAVSSPSAVEVAASSAAAIAPAAVSTVGAGETASSFQAALMKQMAGRSPALSRVRTISGREIRCGRRGLSCAAWGVRRLSSNVWAVLWWCLRVRRNRSRLPPRPR